MSPEEQLEWLRLHVLPDFNDRVMPEQSELQREPDLLDILESGNGGDRIDISLTSRQAWPVDLADTTWPLSEEVFVRFAERKAAEHGIKEWRGGFERVGNACRTELRLGIEHTTTTPDKPLFDGLCLSVFLTTGHHLPFVGKRTARA